MIGAEVIAFVTLGLVFTYMLYISETKRNKLKSELIELKKQYTKINTDEIIQFKILPRVSRIYYNIDSIIPDNDFDHDMYSGDYGSSEAREFHPADEDLIDEVDSYFDQIISNNIPYLLSDKMHELYNMRHTFNLIRYNKNTKDDIIKEYVALIHNLIYYKSEI